MRRTPITLALVLATALVALLTLGAGQSIPPFPVTYSGDITVEGDPVRDGLSLVACVDGCDNYESGEIQTAGSAYRGLVVGPPSEDFVNKQVTFWLVTEEGRVEAEEKPTFAPTLADLTPTLDLTFTEPVPEPAATPVPTPAPTPVLPIPGDPTLTQLPVLALAAGALALVAGASALFVAGRRRGGSV